MLVAAKRDGTAVGPGPSSRHGKRRIPAKAYCPNGFMHEIGSGRT